MAETSRGGLDWLLAALCVAFPVGVAVAWSARDPGACFLGPDVEFWGAAVSALLRGELGAVAELGRSPLYPLVSALLSSIGLPVEVSLVLVSALGLGCTGGLSYWWASSRWGRWAGVLAAFPILAQPFIIGHAIHGSAEGLFVLTLLAAVLALVRLDRSQGWGWALLAGLALGMASQTKPQAVLIAPLALALPWFPGARPRRGWLSALVLVGFALPHLGWLVVADNNALGTHLGILGRDAFDAPRPAGPEASLGWARHLEQDGLDTSWFRSSPLPAPLKMVLVNLRRLVGMLLGALIWLWWVPVGVVAALRDPDRRKARDAAIVLLAVGSFLLSLPVYWQQRHMVPFLVPLAMLGGAGIWRLLDRPRWGRPLLGAVALSAVVGSAVGLWRATQSYDEHRRYHRCDDGSHEAIMAVAPRLGMRPGFWVHDHDNLLVNGAALRPMPVVGYNPFLAPLGPEQDWPFGGAADFYLVLYPYLRDSPSLWKAVDAQGLDARAELVWEGPVPSAQGTGPMRVYRLSLDAETARRPRQAQWPEMGHFELPEDVPPERR